MPRYYLIRLANTSQDQLTELERDEVNLMKTKIIYKDTIQEIKKLFPDWFQDIKEDVEDFILALQHRDISVIRQGLKKVPEFSTICDQTGLLDAEATLWMNGDPWNTADQLNRSATLPSCT